MKCEYGCDQEAKFQLKNNKWCCSEQYRKCPKVREKNSIGLKKAYQEGRKNRNFLKNNYSEWQGWLKGKSAYNDPRIYSKFETEEVFCENSKASNQTIKRILINDNTFKQECNICKITQWNNKKIDFDLDHINGNSRDNRLSNIRLLCPNCHSQTDNYKGRNIKRLKYKVADEVLLESFRRNNSIHRTLLDVGLAPKGGNYFRLQKLLTKNNITY